MRIYTGTVTDVTEEILWTWLLRDVLRGAVELHAGEDGAQRLGCTIADPTNPAEWQHYLLAVTRQPYMTRCTFIHGGKSSREQPATDEPMQHAGALQLTQWRASEVNVTLWEEAPGLLTARLQTWLGMDYDCTMLELQVTPEEERKLANVAASERTAEVAVLARRQRDPHNQRAIERIQAGEPPHRVRSTWKEDYLEAKGRYPSETASGEEELWYRNVMRKIPKNSPEE